MSANDLGMTSDLRATTYCRTPATLSTISAHYSRLVDGVEYAISSRSFNEQEVYYGNNSAKNIRNFQKIYDDTKTFMNTTKEFVDEYGSVTVNNYNEEIINGNYKVRKNTTKYPDGHIVYNR
ncbi:hypothetical protein KQX54_019000 [Cotesia glomerata]|uniref:Uncharacterized protein n=1 Tax=Cotesia glomerata TaxID=32391 RepID=A0AAV7HVM5_COTGL|nr:hypothetical protein KQX54_019000 [Cotesia glomerata]